MTKRTLRQHALAAALALAAAAAAGWIALHALALRTEAVPPAAPGLHIPNLGNTLEEQTRNLSRLSQALRTGDRLVILGSSELTSNDLRFVPYRYLPDELQMPVLAYGHSGFQSLGMQLVLAALADDLSPASRVVVMLSPGWFDGDGGLGPDEFKEHVNPLLPRLLRQPEGRAELLRWLRAKGDAGVAWSMAAEQARMAGNPYAVRDEFFGKYLRTVPAGGKTAWLPQPLTGRDELRELDALMALLRGRGVDALFVMQPLHPLVFKDLDRFEPVRREVAALCGRYAMRCMDMYGAPFEVGTLRDVQHLGELGWLRVNQKIAETFRP